MTEIPVDPSQRSSPEKPFVDITHENCAVLQIMRIVYSRKKRPGLGASFNRSKAEMGGKHSDNPGAAIDIDINRPTLFPTRIAQIYFPAGGYRVAGQQHIAVCCFFRGDGRPCYGLIFLPAPCESEFLYGLDIFHLLEGKNVGMHLFDNGTNPFRAFDPVPADTAMNIVGGQFEEHEYLALFQTRKKLSYPAILQVWLNFFRISSRPTRMTTINPILLRMVIVSGLVNRAEPRSTMPAMAKMPGSMPKKVPTIKSIKRM